MPPVRPRRSWSRSAAPPTPTQPPPIMPPVPTRTRRAAPADRTPAGAIGRPGRTTVSSTGAYEYCRLPIVLGSSDQFAFSRRFFVASSPRDAGVRSVVREGHFQDGVVELYQGIRIFHCRGFTYSSNQKGAYRLASGTFYPPLESDSIVTHSIANVSFIG